jgi:hypothetical protein
MVPPEQYLEAGESVLRHRQTPSLRGQGRPRRKPRPHSTVLRGRKGRRLKFRHRVLAGGGNTTDPQNVTRCPRESFLFFLTANAFFGNAVHGIGLSGEVGGGLGKRNTFSFRRVRSAWPLKIGANESMIRLVRTHHRIRFPRLTASGPTGQSR